VTASQVLPEEEPESNHALEALSRCEGLSHVSSSASRSVEILQVLMPMRHSPMMVVVVGGAPPTKTRRTIGRCGGEATQQQRRILLAGAFIFCRAQPSSKLFNIAHLRPGFPRSGRVNAIQ
jgi:hypothetical protein